MSDSLRVDAEESRMAAHRLDMHAAKLAASGHAAAHAVGATLSAAALIARIVNWERETAEHHGQLEHHGEGHRAASATYTTTDWTSSTQIATGRRPVPPPPPAGRRFCGKP